MKKHFFSGILALVLVAFMSYGISKNQSVDQISNLAFQNVEALASIKDPGGGSGNRPFQTMKWYTFFAMHFACTSTYTSTACKIDC